MAEYPSGTVTFLFTDVEGSTRLWEEHPDEMRLALERHDELLRSAIASFNGYVFSTAGDSFAAGFHSAGDAVGGALAAQAALASESWPAGVTLRVRMGLHVGEAHEREGDYFGPAVNTAARIMSAGHGGQILASAAVVSIFDPSESSDLGEHRLKDLTAARQLWQLGVGEFPPLRTLNRVSNNLPVERTVLLGRDVEVAEIAEMLAQHRLVTLLGMGGTGKTRLASAVAADVAHDFADGAWFVDLVPTSGADQAAEAIATAMGLQLAGADLVAALANLVADRELLVVLDNCEHITDDVADVVDALLERTSRLRLLATSREPLQLPDERQVQVPPLDVTDGLASPAVQLFLTAAERVGAEVPPEEIASVTQICAHLDGLPLAVELAAAQLRQLGVGELADRLDQRFELLARGRRQRGRQSSLQAVLEDTWAMLDATEEQMLLQLAGELSSMAPARTIAGLVDLGLVAWSIDGRHRLLETVKLFARQAWAANGDADEYLERHTRWVLACLDAYGPQAWFTSLEVMRWASSHYDDHRAVEDRLTTAGRASELTRLLSALTFAYTYDTGTRASAAIDRIEQHLERLDLSDHERGLLNLVIASAGLPARRPDWIERGSSTAVPLLREHGTPEELAAALIVNSWMIVFQDGEAALVLLDEARALADAADAPVLADVASGYLVTHYAVAGRIDDSLQTLADLKVRVDGRPMDYGGTLYAYGTMAVRFMTEPDAARAAGQYLVREFAKAPNGGGDGRNEIYLVALAARGDVTETRSLVAEAKIMARRQSGNDGLPDLLIPPAALAWRLGQFDIARRWLTAIRRAPKPTKSFHMTIMYRQLRTAVGLLDENPLDSATIDDIWDEAVAWMDTL